MIDEVGHAVYNRLLLTPVGMAVARSVLPLITAVLPSILEESAALGMKPLTIAEAMAFDFETIPEEVRRRAFVA